MAYEERVVVIGAGRDRRTGAVGATAGAGTAVGRGVWPLASGSAATGGRGGKPANGSCVGGAIAITAGGGAAVTGGAPAEKAAHPPSTAPSEAVASNTFRGRRVVLTVGFGLRGVNGCRGGVVMGSSRSAPGAAIVTFNPEPAYRSAVAGRAAT